jgi:hypothetical protein
VLSCFESRFDDGGLRCAVDCSALEGVLPTSLVAAAGSARDSFSSEGLMRMLGFIQMKLDRVLGLVDSDLGSASGPVSGWDPGLDPDIQAWIWFWILPQFLFRWSLLLTLRCFRSIRR